MASLTPVDLRCDYAVNPFGVDSTNPHLFWQLDSHRTRSKTIRL